MEGTKTIVGGICLRSFKISERHLVCVAGNKVLYLQHNNLLLNIVLKYLYKSGKNIVSKSELLQEVWGYSPDVSTHTIETHIYRLRQKVEHGDEAAQLILTNEGGYLLKM